MKSRLSLCMAAGLLMLGIIGIAGEAVAIPVEYIVSGSYGVRSDKVSMYNFSGFLLIDDRISSSNPADPYNSPGSYDILKFVIQSDPDHFYDFSFSGNDGALSFNFLLDASLQLNGKDGTTYLQYFDSITTSNTSKLLDRYLFVEMFQYSFPDGYNDISFRGLTIERAPVPEPATMLLFGAGLVGLAGTKFRRKKK